MRRALCVILGGALALAVPAAVAENAAVETRVETLLKQLSPDEKLGLLGGTGFATQPIERLGIPAFRMSDGPCGVRGAGPSTAYTAGVCLAASWDGDLARRVGVPLYPSRAPVDAEAPVPGHMAAALAALGFAGDALLDPARD